MFEAESPRGGSALWEGPCVDVEGPADMFLSSEWRRMGRLEVGEDGIIAPNQRIITRLERQRELL